MKELIKIFCNEYLNRTGLKYTPSWGRDSKIFKNLLNDYSVEVIEDVIIGYFKGVEKIYSVPFFKVKFNDILQEIANNSRQQRRMENFDEKRFL